MNTDLQHLFRDAFLLPTIGSRHHWKPPLPPSAILTYVARVQTDTPPNTASVFRGGAFLPSQSSIPQLPPIS